MWPKCALAAALLGVAACQEAAALVSRQAATTTPNVGFWAYAPKPLYGRATEKEKDMSFTSSLVWNKAAGTVSLTLTVTGIDTTTNPITMVHLHPGNIYSETSPIFFFCGAVANDCKQTIGQPVTYTASVGDGYTKDQADAWWRDSVDQLYVAVHTTLSYYPSPIRSQIFPATSVYSQLTVKTTSDSKVLATAKVFFPDELDKSAWMWITFPDWKDTNTLTSVIISTDGTSSANSSSIVHCFCGCRKDGPCPEVLPDTQLLLGGTPRSNLTGSTLASSLSKASLGSAPPLTLTVVTQAAGAASSKLSALKTVSSIQEAVGSAAHATSATAGILMASACMVAAIVIAM